MSLRFGQVLYAQLVLIVVFVGHPQGARQAARRDGEGVGHGPRLARCIPDHRPVPGGDDQRPRRCCSTSNLVSPGSPTSAWSGSGASGCTPSASCTSRWTGRSGSRGSSSSAPPQDRSSSALVGPARGLADRRPGQRRRARWARSGSPPPSQILATTERRPHRWCARHGRASASPTTSARSRTTSSCGSLILTARRALQSCSMSAGPPLTLWTPPDRRGRQRAAGPQPRQVRRSAPSSGCSPSTSAGMGLLGAMYGVHGALPRGRQPRASTSPSPRWWAWCSAARRGSGAPSWASSSRSVCSTS